MFGSRRYPSSKGFLSAFLRMKEYQFCLSHQSAEKSVREAFPSLEGFPCPRKGLEPLFPFVGIPCLHFHCYQTWMAEESSTFPPHYQTCPYDNNCCKIPNLRYCNCCKQGSNSLYKDMEFVTLRITKLTQISFFFCKKVFLERVESSLHRKDQTVPKGGRVIYV